MSELSSPVFSDYIADEISSSRIDLAEVWVSSLIERLGVTRRRAVPTDHLLDHIPVVLEGIAEYVRMPVEGVKSEVGAHLRLLAELRREQGYDVEELLAEFELMGEMLAEQYIELVRTYPGKADPVDVAVASARLREGLSAVTAVTIAAHREEEGEHKRELARRLSEFGHALAHALKTPLQAATTAMHMLREERVLANPPEHARLAELCIRNLERSFALVDDVRVLALSESAQSAERWVPLQQVISSVLVTFSDAAEAKGVRLDVQRKLPQIGLDAVRIEIALANLISNAIKYCDPQKQDRWVRIGVDQIQGEHFEKGWRIWVSDNGVGIPADTQNRVFQRHLRLHPELAEGTGLGLSITHEVVAQKGGRLTFSSVEGEGSTFCIDLPERQVQTEEWKNPEVV